MCYSMDASNYRLYERMGGTLNSRAFADLFRTLGERSTIASLVPRAVRNAFAQPRNADEASVRDTLLDAYRAAALGVEETIAVQTERPAKAQASLARKPTKTAEKEVLVATGRIAAARAKLSTLVEQAQADGWARIWPGHYMPILVRDPATGDRSIIPMRYRARPIGWTARDEREKPGCYNARKSSLRSAWRGLFGYTHGVVVASRFYESVQLHENQQRALVPGETEQAIEIVFTPEPKQDLLLAYLWRYVDAEGDAPGFYGFAAITRDPPPEVRLAGHNRCIIPIRPQHVEAWLNPDPADLKTQLAILDNPIDAYFSHQLVATMNDRDD